MTATELRELHPDKSEMWVRLNATDPVRRHGPAPVLRSPRPAKAKRGSRVPLTRNGGQWSEARFWQAVRSGLRRAFLYWSPAAMALHAARIPCRDRPGQKWAYRCARCEKYHVRKRVQIDHKLECGALKRPEDLADFLARLTPEDPAAYQILCLTCHPKKTAAARVARGVPRVTYNT